MKEEKSGLRTLRSGKGASVRRRGSHGRVAALLIFGAIAVLIAKQEVPLVDGWISRLLDEDGWRAAEQCRALARSTTGGAEFTRMLRAGKAQRTEGGYYVSGVVLALLNSAGEERTWNFSCNVSPQGEVLAINSTVVTDTTGNKSVHDATTMQDTFRDP